MSSCTEPAVWLRPPPDVRGRGGSGTVTLDYLIVHPPDVEPQWQLRLILPRHTLLLGWKECLEGTGLGTFQDYNLCEVRHRINTFNSIGRVRHPETQVGLYLIPLIVNVTNKRGLCSPAFSKFQILRKAEDCCGEISRCDRNVQICQM